MTILSKVLEKKVFESYSLLLLNLLCQFVAELVHSYRGENEFGTRP